MTTYTKIKIALQAAKRLHSKRAAVKEAAQAFYNDMQLEERIRALAPKLRSANVSAL